MSTFKRRLNETFLTPESLATYPWFGDLLAKWQPAGAATLFDSQTKPAIATLRLAIRDGYVNFYCGGQSVGEVSFGKTGLTSKIHVKYLECNQKEKSALGQAYVTLSDAGSRRSDYGSVDNWMRNTQDHQGAEKTFVERIVAANANVIDLEMGLPGFEIDGEGSEGTLRKKVAPRMDIVALEPCADGWRIVFWEAKLVTNGEARAQGASLPAVIRRQRANYRQWLGAPGNSEAVILAYRETCRLLVQLHDLARIARKGAIAELGEGIRAVADNPDIPLSVDNEIRLLIDTSAGDGSFVKKGHLEKIENEHIHVQMVRTPDADQLLLETVRCP